MAIYRCRNCGHVFAKDVKDKDYADSVRCPKCGSNWVVYVRPGLEVSKVDKYVDWYELIARRAGLTARQQPKKLEFTFNTPVKA